LENHAGKWIDMGKRSFRGLASRQELKDFWLVVALALVVGFIGRACEQGWSVEYSWLKLKSAFAGIHIEPEMIEIKGGAFQMGDVTGRGDKDAQPVHEVKFQKSFKLGKYEVMFDEYDRFAIVTGKPLPHDHGWGRGQRPVMNVSWEDARDFADWLSKQTGKRYRLPSEAEWEYAARSGEKNEVWAGTSDEKQLDNYAVFRDSQTNQTEFVGNREPNGLGLYDMSGNVWEWVEDCLHDDYREAPADGSAWLEANGGNCGRRILRGGSWGSPSADLRASSRFAYLAGFHNFYLGFRLAQDID
jgi:formylglycine-generating enzyme required for sulfatase activity